MSKKNKLKVLKLNKTTIKIIYYAVLLFMFIIAAAFSNTFVVNEIVERIACIILGIYLLFGLYIDISYEIHMFDKWRWARLEEKAKDDINDWIGRVIILIMALAVIFH